MRTILVEMPDTSEPYEVTRLLSNERSNAKLRKSAGGEWLLYGLSLAPAKVSGHQVCASSSAGCRKACIFTSGCGGYPSVSLARIARTRAWFQKRGEFKEKFLEELGNAERLAERRGRRLGVRLNVFSDIMWENIFPEVFTEFPEVTFYDYSKHFERMMKFCRGDSFPANYYLTFSRSENNWDQCHEVLKAGRNVSVPFTINQVMHPENNVPLPKRYKGFKVFNGDETDLRFLDPQGVIVGIKTKGMGFWDDSGFTVNVFKKSKMKRDNHVAV